eukprot:TRINITY_DN22074_c0_g1_i1.p1 TRINITY_DN22074_c0_g1~~TRINITY_DN22074_c0_g1_i1.p1  ORF type:complete len:908 (+),score=151.64 TRINITY_DN22074_c0_g1_i1:90-2813(+)
MEPHVNKAAAAATLAAPSVSSSSQKASSASFSHQERFPHWSSVFMVLRRWWCALLACAAARRAPKSVTPRSPKFLPNARPFRAEWAENMRDLSIEAVRLVVNINRVAPTSKALAKNTELGDPEPHHSRIGRLLRLLGQKHKATFNLALLELRIDKEAGDEQIREIVGALIRSGVNHPETGDVFWPIVPHDGQDKDRKLNIVKMWAVHVPKSVTDDPRYFLEMLLLECGCFHEERNVVKRCLRMDLLFSQTVPTVEEFDLVRVNDIERNGYKFTDGCGRISQKLFNAMQDRFAALVGGDLIPTGCSACIIRVLGYKGLVYVDPTLTGARLALPESMRKFATPFVDDMTMMPKGTTPSRTLTCKACPIEVVEWSRKTEARVPQQIMMLLEARNPKAATHVLTSAENELRQLQDKTNFFRMQATKRMEKNSKCVTKRPFMDLTEVCLRKLQLGISPECDTHLKRRILKAAKNHAAQITKRVPVSKSWYALQVPDWTGSLPPGYCLALWEKPGSFLTLAKCPCYEPGNVRRLKVADPAKFPELQHMKDVVVISTQGERPESDMAAGADYDGDKPFVSSNPALVPEDDVTPQSYCADKLQHNTSTNAADAGLEEDLLHYIMSNLDSTLGYLDYHMMRLAAKGSDRMRTDNYKCLAKMFSQEVDAPKTGSRVSKSDIDAKIANAPGNKEFEFQCFELDDYNNLAEKPGRQDRVKVKGSTLVSKVFATAKDVYDKLNGDELSMKAPQRLDAKLMVAWEEIPMARKGILRQAGRGIYLRFQKEASPVALYAFSRRKHRNDVREAVYQDLDQKKESSPYSRFLEKLYNDFQEEVQHLASPESAAPGEELALALYIEKYDGLVRSGASDTNDFPWCIVGKELLQILEKGCLTIPTVPERLLNGFTAHRRRHGRSDGG